MTETVALVEEELWLKQLQARNKDLKTLIPDLTVLNRVSTPTAARLFPFSEMEGALLIYLGYHNPAELNVRYSMNHKGIQAWIVKYGSANILLIQGSNELTDWVRYDLVFWPRKESGDNYEWHHGFLSYARAVYYWVKGLEASKTIRVDYVVGHSLGAAAASIVGSSLNRCTMTFACPAPLYIGLFANPNDKAPLLSVRDKILNIQRTDDTITRLPPKWWGFAHIGISYSMVNPRWIEFGEDHRIQHYMMGLAQNYRLTEIEGITDGIY